MLNNIFTKINWIDILAVILLIRICYISMKCGFIAEFFKITGTILAIFLSLHYYLILSSAINSKLPFKGTPAEILNFISFIALVILGYGTFMLFRIGISRFIKMEATAKLNQYGGLAMGVVRWFFLFGLLIFILVISGVPYCQKSVANSFSGLKIINIVPGTYNLLWNGIASKFMDKEVRNETPFTIINDLKK